MGYKLDHHEIKAIGTAGKGDLFKGKRVFVTGGSSGIGFGIAQRALERGAKEVWICSANSDRITEAGEKLKAFGNVTYRAVDTRKREEVEAYMDDFAKGGSVDFVFANAGISGTDFFECVPEDLFRNVWEVNVMGTFYTDRAALKYMLPQGSGYILNTSSMEGFCATAYYTPYTTSKFAIVGMTESIRREYESRGIKVGCIMPGAVKSNIWGRTDDGVVHKEVLEKNTSAGALTECESADEIFAGMEEQRNLIFVNQLARDWYGVSHTDPYKFDQLIAGYSAVMEGISKAKALKTNK